MKISGFILDIDGTLLDSKEANLKAWQQSLECFDVFKTEDEIVQHFGKSTYIIAGNLLGSDNSDDIKELSKKKSDLILQGIPKVPLYDGVSEILNLIHEKNVKISFASSNPNCIIEKIYNTHNWSKISEGFIGLDDIENPKPHPEMIIKALELLRLNEKPHDVAMVGDSTYDIDAGKSAFTRTFAVCTKYKRIFWEQYSPDLILEEFSDLKKYLDVLIY